MLGPIFQNFEAFVTDSLGEDAWEEVILRSELSEPDAAYSSLGMYPDSDLSALLNASVEISGLEASVLLERFGIFLLMRFSERFPAYFESSDGVISFSPPLTGTSTFRSASSIQKRKLRRSSFSTLRTVP